MNVAVLGASEKKDRYSYKALKALQSKGHSPFPVNPTLCDIEGMAVYKRLEDIPDAIDTLTVYLSPAHSNTVAEGILNSRVRRVIFNPGAENPSLALQLKEKNIQVINGCTLVMLSTGQF